MTQAAHDLQCSEDQVTLTTLQSSYEDHVDNVYQASGCGETVYYTCGGAGWLNNSNGDCNRCSPSYDDADDFDYCTKHY